MNMNKPGKENLRAKSIELQNRLDKIITSIVREFDLESAESTTRLKKARTLCEDLKRLEPAIDALDQ